MVVPRTIFQMSDSADVMAQARNSIDDVAQIREGRTVSLTKYRNIGIMAHIDAGKLKYFILTSNWI